jgi:hypothetical protein
MTSHAKSLEELINRLPPRQQAEVRNFVESLVARHEADERGKGTPTAVKFEQLFGSWESGEENYADNERIDADLAREYVGRNEPGD